MGDVLAASRPQADPPSCPLVCVISDSIWYGVNNETLAGPREPIYETAQASGVNFLRFVGTQSFAGNGSGLAVNPQCESYPGRTLTRQADQVPPDQFASVTDAAAAQLPTLRPAIVIIAAGTNDIATFVLNVSAAAAATALGVLLDVVQAVLATVTPRYQIVIVEVLRRDDADNAKVIEFNALVPGVIAGKAYASHVTIATGTYDAATEAGMADAVHLNDVGSTLVAAAAWPTIEAAIVAAR